jgi:hypothetical protein
MTWLGIGLHVNKRVALGVPTQKHGVKVNVWPSYLNS